MMQTDLSDPEIQQKPTRTTIDLGMELSATLPTPAEVRDWQSGTNEELAKISGKLVRRITGILKVLPDVVKLNKEWEGQEDHKTLLDFNGKRDDLGNFQNAQFAEDTEKHGIHAPMAVKVRDAYWKTPNLSNRQEVEPKFPLTPAMATLLIETRKKLEAYIAPVSSGSLENFKSPKTEKASKKPQSRTREVPSSPKPETTPTKLPNINHDPGALAVALAQETTLRMLAETELRCERMKEETRRQCDQMLAETQEQCDRLVRGAEASLRQALGILTLNHERSA